MIQIGTILFVSRKSNYQGKFVVNIVVDVFVKKNYANVNAPLLTFSKEASDSNGVVLLVVNVTPCHLLEDEV